MKNSYIKTLDPTSNALHEADLDRAETRRKAEDTLKALAATEEKHAEAKANYSKACDAFNKKENEFNDEFNKKAVALIKANRELKTDAAEGYAKKLAAEKKCLKDIKKAATRSVGLEVLDTAKRPFLVTAHTAIHLTNSVAEAKRAIAPALKNGYEKPLEKKTLKGPSNK